MTIDRHRRVLEGSVVGVGLVLAGSGLVFGRSRADGRPVGSVVLDSTGYLVVLVGVAVAVGGALAMAFHASVASPISRWRRSGNLTALVGLLIVASLLVQRSGGSRASSTEPDGAVVEWLTTAGAGAAGHEGHGGVGANLVGGHSPGPAPFDLLPSPAARDRLSSQLGQSRRAAARYQDPRSAAAAGYRQIAPYLPGQGVHWLKQSLLDDQLDFSTPELLLFDRVGPTAHLIGVAYIYLGERQPVGFEGSADRWHVHQRGFCTDPTGFVIGPEQMDDASCHAIGGVKEPGTGQWVLHAWVVDGWEDPWGIFAGEQPQLDGWTDWGAIPAPGGVRDEALAYWHRARQTFPMAAAEPR